MWVCKFKLYSSGGFLGSFAKKHKVNILAYPLSHILENKKLIINATFKLIGNSDNIKNFVKEYCAQSKVIDYEFNKDFLLCRVTEMDGLNIFYNSHFVFLQPVLYDEKGVVHFVIASFNKKRITSSLKEIKKILNIDNVEIFNKNISNISVITTNPILTNNQEKAINIAIKNGYYNVPRNIDLISLARIMDISYSTYQVHLRKAERKLIPYYYNN